VKKTLFFIGLSILVLTSCHNNKNNIKSILEISVATVSNVSNEVSINLANPGDICPVSMPFNTKKDFDKNGNLIQEIIYTTDATVSSAVKYEYYGDLETKKITYSATGSEEESIVSEYEKGKLSKSTHYTPFGTVSMRDEYTYLGNQTTQTTFDENNNCFMKVRSTFDNDGNKTLDEYEIFGTQTTTSYKYNNEKLLIEQKDGDGTVWNFNYDKNGNITEKKGTFVDGSSSTETYDYKYNEHNDWIEKNCYYDGTLIYKTKREIEYYK